VEKVRVRSWIRVKVESRWKRLGLEVGLGLRLKVGGKG
jgi:hypothetical protein